MLQSKSLTELRGIAQSFGIPLDLSKDKAHLIQAIEAKQQALAPKEPPPQRPVDGRLTYRLPARRSDKDSIMEILEPYISRGLKVEFPDEDHWSMRIGARNDFGTIRMPLRHVVNCAENLFK